MQDDGNADELRQRAFDQEQMRAQEEKLKRGEFSLDDFRKQMAMIAKPGFIQKMMNLAPGMGPMREALHDFDSQEMRSLFGIIDAMTPAERSNVRMIDTNRRNRIAQGAGCEPHHIGEFIKQYEAMAGVMTAMAGKGLRERMNMMGDAERKNREWPFKRRRDEDDEDPPPDEPLSPVLA